MEMNTAGSVRLRSRAALLAGAAAAALLAWGWLAPADGSVPGWEPVNAQVAAAVADAERGDRKAEATHEATSSAQAEASAASVQPVKSTGPAEPAAGRSKTIEAQASGASEIKDVDTAEASDAAAKDGKLDINAASAAELDGLPGIGPSKAEAIVQYRDAHGRFESPEALTDVKGIGDKLLAKLLPLVKAG
ncbi:competence protein ComEA [Cohnella sp. OV330]|uniref:ComEA family DNA-binding protein n=1 Tax=Cohnella sp. OV330 TaxID=1855288 RepID=UPI0008E05C7B|nr:helix-hairpin-helix domain-containing protein [Cohnella sp. OV330]SFB34433.1 competence protein ComEA [Cohnella sp. OV330]